MSMSETVLEATFNNVCILIADFGGGQSVVGSNALTGLSCLARFSFV